MSPCGVEVACALMCTTVDGRQVAFFQREPHRPLGAGTERLRLGDVVPVGGQPGAGHLGVHPRPRAAACSALSSTSTPAPSPSTKPSRPLVPRPRRALRVVVALDSAIIWPNAASGSAKIAPSVPPTHDDVGAAHADHGDSPSRSPRCRRRRQRSGAWTPALAPSSRPTKRPPRHSASASGWRAARPGAGLGPQGVVVGQRGGQATDAGRDRHTESLVHLDRRRDPSPPTPRGPRRWRTARCGPAGEPRPAR